MRSLTRTTWGAVPVGGPPIRPLCLTPESLQQNDVAHMDTNGCVCPFPYIIIDIYIYMCILSLYMQCICYKLEVILYTWQRFLFKHAHQYTPINCFLCKPGSLSSMRLLQTGYILPRQIKSNKWKTKNLAKAHCPSPSNIRPLCSTNMWWYTQRLYVKFIQ